MTLSLTRKFCPKAFLGANPKRSNTARVAVGVAKAENCVIAVLSELLRNPFTAQALAGLRLPWYCKEQDTSRPTAAPLRHPLR